MQRVLHSGDDTEIAATSTQGPKQFWMVLTIGGYDPSVRKHDLCGEQVVER